eukprot:597600-Lingulodinium_polyedra.AAC.1
MKFKRPSNLAPPEGLGALTIKLMSLSPGHACSSSHLLRKQARASWPLSETSSMSLGGIASAPTPVFLLNNGTTCLSSGTVMGSRASTCW